MEITFRPMEIQDLSFFNTIRNDSTKYLHDDTQYSLESNKLWYEQNNNLYLIVTVNDIDVGYIRTSNQTENSIYIGMDIDKQFRGQGLSKPIYYKLFEYIQSELNINILKLEVLETNSRALHIYKSLGFCEYDRYKFKNTNSIKMILTL